MRDNAIPDNAIPGTLPGFLWHYFRHHPVANSVILLASFAATLDLVGWPYIFKRLIDAISNYHGDKAQLFTVLSPTLWLMAGLWLAVMVSWRLQGAMMAFYFPRTDAEVHRELFAYVQRHSHRYFSDRLVGSVADKIGGQMSGSATMLTQVIMTAFLPGLASVLIVILVMARMEPVFALVLGGWALSFIAVGFIGGKGISRRTSLQAEALSTMHGAAVDSLGNHATVRLYARQQQEAEYVARYRGIWRQKLQSALWYHEKIRIVMGFLAGAAYMGLIWLALYSWQHDRITTGSVVYVLAVTGNIITMVWEIVSVHVPAFYKQVGICTQAMRTVLVPHEIADAPDARPLKVTEGGIVFENVHFHYIPGRDIFRGKNIAIRPGEKVGLVGFSGSGKSTFVNLILRIYEVESGRILIDGQDIARAEQNSLRDAIALIPQDATLFHRTLMDNIRYGRADATDAEVLEASRQAHCHEFITALPEGYNALVGERGVKLSGGQRQRIAIARAMLKNATILILDEATSSLDSVTEKYIQDSLHQIINGRTTIIIAHRLSTLSQMDRILVFREGEIIEDDTHEALLKMGGHYAMLWRMQAGGFLPDANGPEEAFL